MAPPSSERAVADSEAQAPASATSEVALAPISKQVAAWKIILAAAASVFTAGGVAYKYFFAERVTPSSLREAFVEHDAQASHASKADVQSARSEASAATSAVQTDVTDLKKQMKQMKRHVNYTSQSIYEMSLGHHLPPPPALDEDE